MQKRCFSLIHVKRLLDATLSYHGFVLLLGTAIGVVVYTGSETRSVMNTSNPETKV